VFRWFSLLNGLEKLDPDRWSGQRGGGSVQTIETSKCLENSLRLVGNYRGTLLSAKKLKKEGVVTWAASGLLTVMITIKLSIYTRKRYAASRSLELREHFSTQTKALSSGSFGNPSRFLREVIHSIGFALISSTLISGLPRSIRTIVRTRSHREDKIDG
jgi:hypothetical protein